MDATPNCHVICHTCTAVLCLQTAPRCTRITAMPLLHKPVIWRTYHCEHQ